MELESAIRQYVEIALQEGMDADGAYDFALGRVYDEHQAEYEKMGSRKVRELTDKIAQQYC